jgi:hypothetical protein
MRKLYENFRILHKKETIRGNTVVKALMKLHL